MFPEKNVWTSVSTFFSFFTFESFKFKKGFEVRYIHRSTDSEWKTRVSISSDASRRRRSRCRQTVNYQENWLSDYSQTKPSNYRSYPRIGRRIGLDRTRVACAEYQWRNQTKSSLLFRFTDHFVSYNTISMSYSVDSHGEQSISFFIGYSFFVLIICSLTYVLIKGNQPPSLSY